MILAMLLGQQYWGLCNCQTKLPGVLVQEVDDIRDHIRKHWITFQVRDFVRMLGVPFLGKYMCRWDIYSARKLFECTVNLSFL